MLNLINILTLSTALTLQPSTIPITITGSTTLSNQLRINVQTTLKKSEDKTYAYQISIAGVNFEYADNYNTNQYSKNQEVTLRIGYSNSNENNVDIAKYKQFNETYNYNGYIIFTKLSLNVKTNDNFKINFKIRSTTFMEELLAALTTAVQSAVSIFVEGFGGLTQIFYNGTEITFIGGILIVGLAVMFLMMFLRWIVSFVKGI